MSSETHDAEQHPGNRGGSSNVGMFGVDRTILGGRVYEQPSEKATTSPYHGIVGQGLVRLGAWAWALGTVQSLALQLIVGAAWSEPYSWAANNISDLGNVGCGAWDGRYVCSPLHAWMNASFVLQGVLLVVGLVLTGPLWRGGFSGWAWRTLVLLAGAAWVVVGLAPADVNLGLHLLAALVVFFLGNASLLLAANPRRGSGMRKIRPYSLTLVSAPSGSPPRSCSWDTKTSASGRGPWKGWPSSPCRSGRF